jgi:putative aldouronate transport system substrate-binding protein
MRHEAPPGYRMSRRRFISTTAGAAGAVAAAPLLAACGNGASAQAGSTSADELAKILPTYVPLDVSGIKPDFPSVDGSMPGYLNYPTNLIHTVHETPGSGSTYTAVAPDWGAIPRTAGNTYYQALNAALGANMQWQPSNGTTYPTSLPTLFAGNKLPDWIEVPTWAEPSGFGQATQTALADLTPYLAGDKIKEYPNLAGIYSSGWQQGIWDGKISGIPTTVADFQTGLLLYYRADILDKLGIGTPKVTTISDLYDLGMEINDPSARRWAFDDIWTFLCYPWDFASSWYLNDKGDLITNWETEGIIEAMNWYRTLFQAGMVNPDAVAGSNPNSGAGVQRFYSGQDVITTNGGGSWNYSDAVAGAAANQNYRRMAFDFFAAAGGTPRVSIAPPTEYVSYFNKNLKPDQIKELLRIANYLAAPFGSYEYTLVNYGAANVDYTKTSNGPVLTATGNKDVDNVVPNLLASTNNVVSNPGYPDITTELAHFYQRNAKYGYKPLFYAMNITVPDDLATANTYAPFSNTTTANIMFEVVRGRATIGDYQSTLDEWLRNGGNKLKAFYETVRAKYGTA